MPPTADFKIKWKMMKYKYPQYTYLCLKGLGRDKKRKIFHFQKWDEIQMHNGRLTL